MSNQQLRWRVITGYGAMDYISIPEEKLEHAKYAMISGKVFMYDGDMIRGSEIKKIERDYRYYTGWYDTYKPQDGEDFEQMERDMPPEIEFIKREQLGDKRVEYVMLNNKPSLLKDITKIDQLLLS